MRALGGGPEVWPEDYGDPASEHARLVETVGVVPGPDRLLLRVDGERAAQMIGGLVTNEVVGLPADRAVYSFLLTPKGRPVADPRVIRLAEALWLDLPGTAGEAALTHLSRYLPPRFAVATVLHDIARPSLIGPRSEEAADAFARAVAADPPDLSRLPALEIRTVPLAGGGRARLLRREEAEGPGFDLYVPSADPAMLEVLLESARAAGGGPVGRRAFETWRVERGIPAWGSEISPEVLPQETGLEDRAISFTKGCYTGQEVVARIHYRGHVNRHLRGLRFPGHVAPPAAGEKLYAAEREVGIVTSSALSPVFGPIALGYVRREVEPGSRVATSPEGEAGALVTTLPFTYE